MEPDEQNLALSQGLLGLGAGLLSGSFGNYGAFGPALGQGVQGFNQGYGNALQRSIQMKQLKQQQELQTAQIGNYESETNRRNAETAELQRLSGLGQKADAYARNATMPVQPGLGPRKPPAPDPVSGAIIGLPGLTPPVQGVGLEGTQTPQIEVTRGNAALLEDPKYHRARAEFLYQNGDMKGAAEAAKQARELRKEHRGIDAAPATKMLSIGDGMEQEHQWDENLQKWEKISGSAPRPIFNPKPMSVTQNVDMKAETAGMVKMAETDAVAIGEMQKSALAANKLQPILKRMLMNADSTYSGATANYATNLGNLAVTLGVDNPDLIKKVASSEQATADVAELVRSKIKALGSGTAISNVDLLFTNRSMPDLLKTPAGRKMIIKAMQADIDLIVKDHAAARQYFDSHNGSLSGFVPPSASAEPIDFGEFNQPSLDDFTPEEIEAEKRRRGMK